jgi:hypothetical protein
MKKKIKSIKFVYDSEPAIVFSLSENEANDGASISMTGKARMCLSMAVIDISRKDCPEMTGEDLLNLILESSLKQIESHAGIEVERTKGERLVDLLKKEEGMFNF